MKKALFIRRVIHVQWRAEFRLPFLIYPSCMSWALGGFLRYSHARVQPRVDLCPSCLTVILQVSNIFANKYSPI